MKLLDESRCTENVETVNTPETTSFLNQNPSCKLANKFKSISGVYDDFRFFRKHKKTTLILLSKKLVIRRRQETKSWTSDIVRRKRNIKKPNHMLEKH